MSLIQQQAKETPSNDGASLLAGMARFEGSAFGLLRKQPIMFGFAEGVRTSLSLIQQQAKETPSNDGASLLAGMARFELTDDGVKVRCLTTWLHP